MTGEQKPGGLEVVAFGWKGFAGYFVVGLGQPKPFEAEPLTPAEPAEERIREAERRAELYDHMKAVAEANGFKSLTEAIARATAAEAKLARAKEALEQIMLQSEDCLGIRMETITSIADQTLAALSPQPGPASEGDGE